MQNAENVLLFVQKYKALERVVVGKGCKHPVAIKNESSQKNCEKFCGNVKPKTFLFSTFTFLKSKPSRFLDFRNGMFRNRHSRKNESESKECDLAYFLGSERIVLKLCTPFISVFEFVPFAFLVNEM